MSEKKALIGPWAHGWPHLARPGPAIGFLQEALRWWDHWLKDRDTGIMDEPDHRFYIMDAYRPGSFPDHIDGRWVDGPTPFTTQNPSDLDETVGSNTQVGEAEVREAAHDVKVAVGAMAAAAVVGIAGINTAFDLLDQGWIAENVVQAWQTLPADFSRGHHVGGEVGAQAAVGGGHAQLEETGLAQVVVVGKRKAGFAVPLRCARGKAVAAERVRTAEQFALQRREGHVADSGGEVEPGVGVDGVVHGSCLRLFFGAGQWVSGKGLGSGSRRKASSNASNSSGASRFMRWPMPASSA